MGKLISLQKYKDKKQSEELYHKLCREISAKIISLNKQSYYEPELYHDPVDDLLDRIGKLERRHEFDRNLINLIELFLEKEFPEYTRKFDIFLDKYYE